MYEEKDPDILAAKAFGQWWNRAKDRMQWWAVVVSAAMIVLHDNIEANYLAYGPSFPTAHPPFGLDIALKATVLVTFLLGVFCFPRWQSILAFLALGFLICSLGGR